MKAYTEAINTKKWAHAEVSDSPVPPKKQEPEQGSQSANAPNVSNLSAADYEKMFHQATLAANKEVEEKTFTELQEQDIQESENIDKKKKKEKEKEKEKERKEKEPLNKEGFQVNGENPESMGDIQMDQAMGYTDQASSSAQDYNE